MIFDTTKEAVNRQKTEDRCTSKEMKKIVEVRNKHGNVDEFPDFANLFFFFGIKNVRVGGKILGSVGRSETHLFFFMALVNLTIMAC